MCAAASLSSGRRRQVLTKIRAKREMTVVKAEDSEDTSQELSDDRGHGSIDAGGSQTVMYKAISPADEKSLLTEYVLCLLDGIGPELVATWMGDCLHTGKPSLYNTNHQGQLSLTSLR